jgi:hypothetical protein
VSDDEFLAAFEAATISNADFNHRNHLRLAYICISRHGLDAGAARAGSAIRHFAGVNGAAHKYNQTLTIFWMHLVGHAIEVTAATTFEALLNRAPHLLDKTLVARHYSHDALWADGARRDVVPADLVPLPA